MARGKTKPPHRDPRPTTHDSRRLKGQVVASFGRRFLVELPGETLDCVTRGKRTALACGDEVEVARTSEGQGVIENQLPRRTLLYRADRYRQKLIAANATRVILVVAPVPAWHEDLVNRCLAAAGHGGLTAVIALNKSDLPGAAEAEVKLQVYKDLGYPVVTFSAKRDVGPLRPHLEGETSVLVGQSGMGKSTIINALVPDAKARIAEISRALGSGRHTTTHARLYHLDAASLVIDSPGLQEFGLHHLEPHELEAAFVEFRPLLGQCRFRDCRHVTEPGCALAAACERGDIAESRLASYRGLVARPSRR